MAKAKASAEQEEKATVVECAMCGTPGIVKFRGDEMTEIKIACKCKRPSVEEANRIARKKRSGKAKTNT